MNFDHISIGTSKIETLVQTLENELGGLRYNGGYKLNAFIAAAWLFPVNGFIEVIEPHGDDENNFVRKFIRSGGPRIHHVTFLVPDLKKANERAKQLGYEVVGYNDKFEYWKEFFLYPKSSQGIVVQIAESISKGVQTDNKLWKNYVGKRNTHLLGLVMISKSTEKANQLWKEFCCGTSKSIASNMIEYSWPNTGMKIKVIIDPNSSYEGPLRIEFLNPVNNEILCIFSKDNQIQLSKL